MNNILLRIANLLYINVQYMDGYGLLNGKMGAVLFFYEYSRYSGNENYSDFADRMLDEVLEAIEAKRVDGSADLANGLGGIGWGIQYLINHRFIDGDADEVLADFDKRMQGSIDGLEGVSVEDWSKHLSENDFLLSVDTYLYARRMKEEFYNMDNLRKIADFYTKILGSGHVFSLQFLNSCYLFLLLSNPLMGGKYMLVLKNRLEMAYRKSVEQKRYTHSDVKFLRRLEGQGECLIELPHLIENEPKFEEVDSYLQYVKRELLSFDSKYYLLDSEVLDTYLNKGMEDMPSCDLSLGGGVAGVGFFMLRALA